MNTLTINFQDIASLLAQSIKENTCFSSWRLPNQDEIFAATGSTLQTTEHLFADEAPKFIFTPYQNHEKHTSFHITSLYHVTNSAVSDFDTPSIPIPALTPVITTKEAYIQTVQEAIHSIKNSDLQKVVISKVKKINTNPFRYLSAYQKLLHEYKNCFVSLVYTPQSGLWIGATPELLLEKSTKKLKTVALAGTQTNTFGDIKEAFWKQKEIEEQAYVSRYIIGCFKSIRLREFTENGPKTIKAGNLLHLQTEFTIDLDEVNHPTTLADTLVNLIHPTSAVCGMPLEQAKVFISKHEKHSRNQYAGFLGPVNIENQTALYVNLRCAQIANEEAFLYAGAGITEDSIPEKEWEETELKCDILLKKLI